MVGKMLRLLYGGRNCMNFTYFLDGVRRTKEAGKSRVLFGIRNG